MTHSNNNIKTTIKCNKPVFSYCFVCVCVYVQRFVCVNTTDHPDEGKIFYFGFIFDSFLLYFFLPTSFLGQRKGNGILVLSFKSRTKVFHFVCLLSFESERGCPSFAYIKIRSDFACFRYQNVKKGKSRSPLASTLVKK